MFVYIVCVLIFLFANISYGERVLYFNDFENNESVIFWQNYGRPYKVNFKGLTEEYAHSGKKSFKLDVSFPQPGRYIWVIPLEPKLASSDMSLSGYVRVGRQSDASVTLRVFFCFPPTKYSGYTGPGQTISGRKVGWQKVVVGDPKIVNFKRCGESMEDLMLLNYSGYVRRDEIAPAIEKIGIDINTKKAGERVVVYLDDIALIDNSKGNNSDADIRQRYIPAIKRARNKLRKLSKQLYKAQSVIKRYRWRADEQDIKSALEKCVSQALQEVEKKQAEEKPLFDIWWLYEMRRKIERITCTLDNMPKLRKAKNDSHIIYIVESPLDGAKWILPFDVLIPAKIGKIISIEGAGGEYEPASFLIRAVHKLKQLELRASDLVNEKNNTQISADNIDIKVVKCWYQGASAGKSEKQSKGQRVLVPELLLNDDSLIKVDYKRHENYIKLRFADKTEYRWISKPHKRASFAPLVSEFPIRDSSRLLPISLSAGENKQFWITVKIPKTALSGEYKGKVILLSDGKVIDKLDLRVIVLPIALKKPYYTTSIDYHGSLAADGSKATISSWRKSRQQILAELKDMVAHGFENCQHYFAVNDNSLREMLKLRQQAGMDNSKLYLKGHGLYLLHWRADKLREIESRVRHIIGVAKEFGVQEVYFYGRDEVTGRILLAERNSWNAVHRGGGKIFVAGGRDNLALVGDIQDLMIKAGWPDRQQVEGWHKYGHQIFSYANPQTGIENADVYRRNYGLVMWKYDYDGIADNAYQHTYGFIWNDFDNSSYRSHSMTYPTANGVIDTIEWEGFREGIDDVRYITSLEAMIERAKKRIHNNMTKNNINKNNIKRNAKRNIEHNIKCNVNCDVKCNSKVDAKQNSRENENLNVNVTKAERFLMKLKQGNIIETSNLDSLRRKIVRYMISLSE